MIKDGDLEAYYTYRGRVVDYWASRIDEREEYDAGAGFYFVLSDDETISHYLNHNSILYDIIYQTVMSSVQTGREISITKEIPEMEDPMIDELFVFNEKKEIQKSAIESAWLFYKKYNPTCRILCGMEERDFDKPRN